MRNKAEFEAHVKELAQQKLESERKKKRRIRNFTVAGGIAVCAACCIIVFGRFGMNMISGNNTNDTNEGMNSPPEISDEKFQMTEAAGSTATRPEAGEIDINNGISDEDSVIKEIAVITKYSAGEQPDTIEVEGEAVEELYNWFMTAELTEISDKKDMDTDIYYEIKIYENNNVDIITVKNNYILRDEKLYSCSQENSSELAELLSKFYN